MIPLPEESWLRKECIRMKKKVVDERIRKESNAILAKLYWAMVILQNAVLAVKLCLGAEMILWALDGIIILAGLGVMAVLRSIRGLWCRKDEVLREMDNSVLSTAYGTMLWVALIGSVILAFGDTERIQWYAPTILPLLVTSAVYTVLAVRRGLLLWGGQKNKGNAKGQMRKATAFGALFYGAVMGAPDCFVQGVFHPAGLVKVFAMAAMWGLLFYGLMVLIINRGEKAADKAAEEQEEEEDTL